MNCFRSLNKIRKIDNVYIFHNHFEYFQWKINQFYSGLATSRASERRVEQRLHSARTSLARLARRTKGLARLARSSYEHKKSLLDSLAQIRVWLALARIRSHPLVGLSEKYEIILLTYTSSVFVILL